MLTNDIDITTTEEYTQISLKNIESTVTIEDYGNFYISFDKHDFLKIMDSLLLSDTLDKTYQAQLTKSAAYLRSIDTLYITDYYQYQPGKYDLSNERELTQFLILELACPILESGNLLIIKEGNRQKKIYKSTGYFGYGSAPTYWAEDWRPIWICPPIAME